MNPERWREIKSVFAEALELPAERRAGWVEQRCANDSGLAHEVLSLLAAHGDATPKFALDAVPAAQVAAAFNETPPVDTASGRVGMRVGAYRLVELIGRGGMGEVYRAERADEQYEEQVAIKLVRIDSDGGGFVRRFQGERQILAALRHRNIASLLDAGTTQEGTPWLAMEFVDGVPIDHFCRARRLSVHDTVQLFLQVCAAVSFAHQHLVVHRDVKPTNILVTADGSVKLLDFGIAKLLDADSAGRPAEPVETTLRAMTIEYASPEQVRGAAVTTASDIYSLGVVLYRLLTGRSPYRAPNAPQRIAEITGDVTPERPSNVAGIADAGNDETVLQLAPSIREQRRRELRGDLDNILLMALRKEPLRRYDSVDRFAEDLRNHLAGFPVVARGDRWSYRAGKFVGRHRFAVAATVLAVVALIGGAVVSAWQARIAREQSRIALEQSRIAQDEARKARAVQDFLTALFEKNSRLQPQAALVRKMPVSEVLIEAAARVQTQFPDSPSVKLEVMNTVGRMLLDIEEFERAEKLWQSATKLARDNGLTQTDAYVEALIGTTHSARLLGHGEQAGAARDAAVAILDARGDKTSLMRARVLAASIAYLSRDSQREIALVREAVELFRTRYPANPGYFNAINTLAHLYRTDTRFKEAAAAFRDAGLAFERSGSRDYTNYAASFGWAAFCELRIGHIEDALRDYERGIPLLEKQIGPDSIMVRMQAGLYAQALHQAGKIAESAERFEKLLTPEALASADIGTFDASIYRADGLLDERRPAESLRLLNIYEASWVEYGRRFVPNGVQWLTLRARAQSMLGRHAEARATLAEVSKLGLFYGLDPSKSDEYLAATIDVALRADDLPAARAARSSRAALTLPGEFDPGFGEFAVAAGWLALREGDGKEARRLADLAMANLEAHTARNSFPFLTAEAQKLRSAALSSRSPTGG